MIHPPYFLLLPNEIIHTLLLLYVTSHAGRAVWGISSVKGLNHIVFHLSQMVFYPLRKAYVCLCYSF